MLWNMMKTDEKWVSEGLAEGFVFCQEKLEAMKTCWENFLFAFWSVNCLSHFVSDDGFKIVFISLKIVVERLK